MIARLLMVAYVCTASELSDPSMLSSLSYGLLPLFLATHSVILLQTYWSILRVNTRSKKYEHEATA